MQDSKVVRRRRAVFAVLVLASVALVTAAFGESGPLSALRTGVQAVLAPIESGISTAVKPVRDGIGWIGGTLDPPGLEAPALSGGLVCAVDRLELLERATRPDRDARQR